MNAAEREREREIKHSLTITERKVLFFAVTMSIPTGPMSIDWSWTIITIETIIKS